MFNVKKHKIFVLFQPLDSFRSRFSLIGKRSFTPKRTSFRWPFPRHYRQSTSYLQRCGSSGEPL